ncbi:MAG: hypothetical protein ABI761_10845 [Saprospiraceae bacterium]
MKKFIVIYHATPEAVKQMAAATPKQQAKSMEGWMKWAQKSGDQLVEMGAPLMNGISISPDGTSKKSRKNVTGYSIVQAETLDKAKKLFKGHTHLKSNEQCTIEVHEIMPVPGM